ncbi:hypothetical protein O3G_MSEX003465 [Manduca sexta]|uniref:TMC domain-containing protein n=1 Tax=Manduca sexta TaxID=7130 RepID=A0A922CFS5_MANSE|nr:hypothetical protein O3G_MSEX003465 [Manduca sexta]
MLLNLLNLYSLIFALFSKIEGMSHDLAELQPKIEMNATMMSIMHLNESTPTSCFEEIVSCGPCTLELTVKLIANDAVTVSDVITTPMSIIGSTESVIGIQKRSIMREIDDKLITENLADEPSIEATAGAIDNALLGLQELERLRKITHLQFPFNVTEAVDNDTYIDYDSTNDLESTTLNSILLGIKELERLRNISLLYTAVTEEDSDISDKDNDYSFYDTDNGASSINTPIENITNENFDPSDISSRTNMPDSIDNKSTIDDFSLHTDTEMTNISSDTTKIYSLMPETTVVDPSHGSTATTTDLNWSLESTFNDTSTSTSVVNTETQFTFETETTDNSIKLTTNPDESIIQNTSPTDEYSTEYTTLDKSTTGSYITELASTSNIKTELSTYLNPTSVKYEMTDIVTTASTVTTKLTSEVATTTNPVTLCPNITFNCTVTCGGQNVTQIFTMFNCTVVNRVCYVRRCNDGALNDLNSNKTGIAVDYYYIDENNRKMYNLTIATKRKLRKLCWETMFGQELVKLTMMDLVFVLLGTLFMDFFRALFVRYMNRCWCWDLEKKFPEYGDFKIAENILHLINNQGMVWMGMFFSPGLVVLNVVKLMIMMYLRSWAVMTCNVPHEVVFRVSKSNNFYLALLLTMLFLCVLPVGYTIVWVKPSWHCGPFSEYQKIYEILTRNIEKLLPQSLTFALGYIASPSIVIPLLVLLILIIYYLTSLTNSLREANNDLKIQLRRERTEERRKMFQLADTRRRTGSSAMDNTPFARWKKALPSLPLSKSIDSEDRKMLMGDDAVPPPKSAKKRGNAFISRQSFIILLCVKIDIIYH